MRTVESTRRSVLKNGPNSVVFRERDGTLSDRIGGRTRTAHHDNEQEVILPIESNINNNDNDDQE
jgi:hypothetical protein